VKSNFVFFLGLFFALGLSYAGIVLGSNAQLGSLAPYYDDTEGSSFPQWFPGVGARGQLVYKDLGCAACHTQQVRRPGFGSDQARGWGERQSVARDYIYQPAPQLGLARMGPDLTNVGDRKPSAPDADDLLHLLYAGSEGMPSYRFLFEHRRVGVDAQPSDDALKLTGSLEPKAGWEIVPTQRARDLVGYLVSLKTTYDYPEAVPVVPEKPEGGPAAPAKAPAPVAPVPAVAHAPGGETATTPLVSPSPAPAATTSPSPAAGVPTPAGASVTPTPVAGATPDPTVTPAPAVSLAGATPDSPSPSPTATAAPSPAGPTPTPTPTAEGGAK
jgi:cytochrome c oxidase cbb3-type subunit 2